MDELNYYKLSYRIILVALALESILLAFGYQWILIGMAVSYGLLIYFSKEILRVQQDLYRAELDRKFEEFKREQGKW